MELDERVEEITSNNARLDLLRAESSRQGSIVRQLKANGAPQPDVTAAVETLKKLKLSVEAEEKKTIGPVFDRETFDSILLRRMIIVPSFEIYGAEKGLFDLGTEGSLLMDNIVSTWKKWFVFRDNMQLLTGTCLTPEVVLKASGHVDRFTDLMVKDEQTGNCFRADKLLEDCIENLIDNGKETLSTEQREELELIGRKADSFPPDELHALFQRFEIKSPETGNVLSKPFPFNLMFATTIGPEGTRRGFLRPETAQGIFVNFRRCLEKRGGKLPFACAQVGLGFRNEISPKQGLIRVREFLMAEIEHFVDEADKTHPKFDEIKNVRVVLFPRENQLTTGRMVKMSVGNAVKHGIIQNETMAYFIARTHLFLMNIGIDPEKLRFRQHLITQMAHYASDCWDGEILLSSISQGQSASYVECVGLADRSCYDLATHSNHSNTPLLASRKLDVPKTEVFAKPIINKPLMGKKLKQLSTVVTDYINNMDKDSALQLEKKLDKDGKAVLNISGQEVNIERDMVRFEESERTVHVETFFPHVIEPSFGLGRILFSVLEHSFYAREDSNTQDKTEKMKRCVLGLKAAVAPVKCAVLPLQSKSEYVQSVERIKSNLVEELQREGDFVIEADISSVSIGKRYARMDEIGVPFCITVDDVTVKAEARGENVTVTIRERDSTEQVRVSETELKDMLKHLIQGRITWPQVYSSYEKVQSISDD